TFEVENAVGEIKAGKVEYRVDKSSNLHVPIGKVSFDDEQLVENYEAIAETVVKIKPQASKGKYIRNVAIASTMGPGIKLNGPSLLFFDIVGRLFYTMNVHYK